MRQPFFADKQKNSKRKGMHIFYETRENIVCPFPAADPGLGLPAGNAGGLPLLFPEQLHQHRSFEEKLFPGCHPILPCARSPIGHLFLGGSQTQISLPPRRMERRRPVRPGLYGSRGHFLFSQPGRSGSLLGRQGPADGRALPASVRRGLLGRFQML